MLECCFVCGIGGFISASDAAADQVLKALVEAMRHRGPDDSGIAVSRWSSHVIGMCATRLAIRDLSPAGHQPMTSPSGTTVAFNGELYNADELRAQLAGPQRTFRSRSDTEIVLAAYERWGTASFARLRGMFAIAVMDPEMRTLTLARDPFGIKPLYLARTPGGLGFASEIRALVRAGLAQSELSVDGLAGYLALGAALEPLTMLKDVTLLAPGTSLVLSEQGEEMEPFFSLEEAFARTPTVDGDAVIPELRRLLRRAVQRHLVSDVPLGIFLSGGLDSTTLVGLAAESGQRPRTSSIVFTEPEYSERSYIAEVVERYGTVHHEVDLSVETFLDELPGAMAAMDQPTVDGVNTYVVSKLTKKAGLTVALSGLGGDELFAGYDLFKVVPRLESIREFARLPPPLARTTARVFGQGDTASKLARWLAGSEPSAYALHRELIGRSVRTALLGAAPLALPIERSRATDANDVSRLEMQHFMGNLLLRDSDVMSMAHGLELRVPFLDQDLVEFVARLPADLKVERGRQKPLLQDAVRDLLPPAVRNREKMGFTLPFERWLRGPLRAEVCSTLLDVSRGGQVGQALDGAAVRRVWEAFENGRTSWSRPWALYVVKRWGESYL